MPPARSNEPDAPRPAADRRHGTPRPARRPSPERGRLRTRHRSHDRRAERHRPASHRTGHCTGCGRSTPWPQPCPTRGSPAAAASRTASPGPATFTPKERTRTSPQSPRRPQLRRDRRPLRAVDRRPGGAAHPALLRRSRHRKAPRPQPGRLFPSPWTPRRSRASGRCQSRCCTAHSARPTQPAGVVRSQDHECRPGREDSRPYRGSKISSSNYLISNHRSYRAYPGR